LPQTQLASKERFGSRIRKKYDYAKTPFARPKLAPNVSEEKKAALDIQKKSLNPFELKLGLEKKLDLFFRLLKAGVPNCDSGTSQLRFNQKNKVSL